uniref:Uncharacterized protein n=1 Tax=Vitis vinifera TaxID=29760 RepID=A5BGX1_VITVI|nr:hypothetical protein VITISV_012614 [Vitis vinifera]
MRVHRCSLGKRYQRIRTCLTGEIESPSSPIRCQAPDMKYPKKAECRSDRIPDVRHSEKAECRRDRILDVRHPEKGGMSVGQNSGCETSGEGRCRPDRIPDVRHPDKVGCRRIEFRM